MAVNALVTGLIVFRILKVFLEVNTTMTPVERTLGSSGGTKLRHAIFVIIKSGLAMFAIQMVRVVFVFSTSAAVSNGRNFVIIIREMINVIVFLILFCFLITSSGLGHHTNNNSGAGFNQFVLR